MFINILIGIGLIVAFERLMSAISHRNESSSGNTTSIENNTYHRDESDFYTEDYEKKAKLDSSLREITGVQKMVKDFYEKK